MSTCARPGCVTLAKSSCSGCGREQYCGNDCQKLDWKIHKPICPILKTLSHRLQPFHEVVRIIKEIGSNEIQVITKGNDIRVLKHLLAYAEYQFGEKVTGKDYRERADGERINNWNVDINILNYTIKLLCHLEDQNYAISLIDRDNAKRIYQERSLSLLNPWLVILDSDASNVIDRLNEKQKNTVLKELHYTELCLAAVNINSRQFDAAEGHCERVLAYSKRYGLEGEKKTTMIYTALTTYCTLKEHQDNNLDALTFAEEGYNLVVEAYDPVHPQVQEAAGKLIEILIRKGDLFDAERYAQVTYGNLRDKKNGMDQEGGEMAIGAYNLANVIYRQNGDLVKAEELAREALRINTLIYGSSDNNVGLCCNLLAPILIARGDLGDETRGLCERALANSVRNEGPDGFNTATGNFNIGFLYHRLARIQPTVDSKRTQLQLAKLYFVEAQRIQKKMFGSSHPQTIDTAAYLAAVLNELSLM